MAIGAAAAAAIAAGVSAAAGLAGTIGSLAGGDSGDKKKLSPEQTSVAGDLAGTFDLPKTVTGVPSLGTNLLYPQGSFRERVANLGNYASQVAASPPPTKLLPLPSNPSNLGGSQ
jgi:hypothetical protein